MATPESSPRFPDHAPIRLRSVSRDRTDRALVERARREGTQAARRAAVHGLMPLARSLARRYHRGGEPLEDLEQVAALGLLKAIDGFDLDRDTPFGAYAVPTITGELRRHYRDKGWTIRVPRDLQELNLKLGRAQEAATAALGRPTTAAEVAERLGEPVERVLEARELDHAMHPVSLDRPATREPEAETLIERLGGEDDGYARSDDALTAAGLLARLPARERRIVELRFHQEMTQSEIGSWLGISQMQVSRLLRRSLAELNQMAAEEA